MFALARMGGVRAFSSMISQIRNTRLLAMVAPMMVESGAAFCAIPGRRCVGMEINANHVGAIRDGLVVGTARPLHLGHSSQVWEIRIEDAADGRLVCISRLTLAVVHDPGAAQGEKL